MAHTIEKVLVFLKKAERIIFFTHSKDLYMQLRHVISRGHRTHCHKSLSITFATELSANIYNYVCCTYEVEIVRTTT